MRLLIALFCIFLVAGCASNEKYSKVAYGDLAGEAVDEPAAAHYKPNLGIEKGDLAPDFTVKTVDGEIVNLRQLSMQGTPVVVYFWSTWCPYCGDDLADANKAYANYFGKVKVVAIDMDLSENAEKIARYKERRELPMSFAPGYEQILRDYGVAYTTTKYAISRDGIIMWKGSGALNESVWRTIFSSLEDS